MIEHLANPEFFFTSEYYYQYGALIQNKLEGQKRLIVAVCRA